MTSKRGLWRRSGSGQVRAGSRTKVNRSPAFEGLESRSLLAASAFGLSGLRALSFPHWGGFAAAGFHPAAFGGVSARQISAAQAATTLTLIGPSGPVTVGQAINYTAVVGVPAGSTTPPTGTVTFKVDGVTVQPPAPVNSSGLAVITLPSLTAGTHTVSAAYSGDFLYQPSSASTQQVVNKATTSVQLTITPQFPTSSQSVFMNAVVTVPGAGSGFPQFTGSVAFFDNGTPIGSATIGASGLAQLVRRLTVGGHQITATYSGNANFLPATSPAANVTVVPGLPGAEAPAPTVVSVQRFGFHWMPTTLSVSYSSPMDETRVQDPNNYRIVGPGGRVIPVVSAVYDPTSQSVTLSPQQRLNLHFPYQLTVVGTGLNGVTDADGVPLDGAGNGEPGSDFVTLLTARNLVIPGLSPAATARFLRFYRLA